MSDPLQRAIEALTIEDVSIRSSIARLDEEYEPRFDPQADDLQVEIKQQVAGFQVIRIIGEGMAERQVLRVLVGLGVRWRRSADDPDVEDEAEDDVAHDGSSAAGEVALVEAVMVADYSMDPDPGEDALRQFAEQNASFHVWPYWREYVASQCRRMNLPRFMLPIRQFVPPASPPTD